MAGPLREGKLCQCTEQYYGADSIDERPGALHREHDANSQQYHVKRSNWLYRRTVGQWLNDVDKVQAIGNERKYRDEEAAESEQGGQAQRGPDRPLHIRCSDRVCASMASSQNHIFSPRVTERWNPYPDALVQARQILAGKRCRTSPNRQEMSSIGVEYVPPAGCGFDAEI